MEYLKKKTAAFLPVLAFMTAVLMNPATAAGADGGQLTVAARFDLADSSSFEMHRTVTEFDGESGEQTYGITVQFVLKVTEVTERWYDMECRLTDFSVDEVPDRILYDAFTSVLDYAWNGMSGLSVTLRTDTEGRVTRVLNSGEVYRKARAAYDSACKESRYMNSVADAGVDVRRILRADDSYEFAKGIIEDVKALFQLYGNAFAEGETRRHSDQTKDSCESDTSTSLLLDRNSGEYVIFVNADNYIPYFEVESQATDLAGECFNDEVARRLRVISAEEPDRSDRNYAVYNSQLYFRFSSDGWPQEIVSEETTRIVGAGRTERTSVTKLSEKM